MHKNSLSPRPPFLLVGGNPGLDFVNTLIAGADGRPIDLLDSPEAMAAWSVKAGLTDDAGAARQQASWQGAAGNRALEAARKLRAGLLALFRVVIAGENYAKATADLLNPLLENRPLTYAAVAIGKKLRAELRPQIDTDPTDDFFGQIAAGVVNLLTEANPRHIRKCANPACVLLFHDTTKNHRRQWCSMAGCGNRAKASRFRHRRKS